MLFQSSDFDPPMLFSRPGGVDGLGISRMDARTGRGEYSRVAKSSSGNPKIRGAPLEER